MRLLDCDVVVVGAGPAGCLTARTASEKGSNVILIEEHDVVGTPVSCAEGLSLKGILDAGIEPVKPYISQKITKAHIYAPNLRYIELTSENWVGYVLNRNHFDKALGDNAVKSGAQLLNNTSVTGVFKENSRIAGIEAISNGEKIRIKAKITVGADGYSSIIRRSAGMERFYADYVSCAQYTLNNLKLDDSEINEFFLGMERAPGGYAWVFPKNEEVANIGIGVRKIHTRPAVEYLKKFIKEDPRFKDGKIVYKCGGITPASGVLNKIVDDNLMLVGDAAGQIVPCTGAGIHSSIEAGKMAGAEAAEAISVGDTSKERLTRYRDKFEKYWGKRIRNSQKIVEMLDKFKDDDLNSLAEIITNDEILALANGEGTAQALARIIARSPGKIVKLMTAYLF
jgi:digeranylgeranylglycerophospholipid reductase